MKLTSLTWPHFFSNMLYFLFCLLNAEVTGTGYHAVSASWVELCVASSRTSDALFFKHLLHAYFGVEWGLWLQSPGSVLTFWNVAWFTAFLCTFGSLSGSSLFQWSRDRRTQQCCVIILCLCNSLNPWQGWPLPLIFPLCIYFLSTNFRVLLSFRATNFLIFGGHNVL